MANGAGGDNMIIRNCTVFNVTSGSTAAYAYYVDGTGGEITNCYGDSSGGSEINFNIFGGTNTESYNISADASAEGTGSLTSRAAADQFVSVVSGSEDATLLDTADCAGAGTDLSGNFTTDITGATRDATWDVGAYAIVVGGTSFFGLLIVTGKQR